MSPTEPTISRDSDESLEFQTASHSSEARPTTNDELSKNRPLQRHYPASKKWITIAVDCGINLLTLALLAFVSFIATTNRQDIDNRYGSCQNALLVVRYPFDTELNVDGHDDLKMLTEFTDCPSFPHAFCRSNESASVPTRSMEARERFLIRHT